VRGELHLRLANRNLRQNGWVKSSTKKNEKEAGTGDDFKKRWEAAKPGPFESSFEVKLAEEWKGVTCKRGLTNAKYTIVIKVRYADPGFSMGVSAADAWLSATIEVVETGSKNCIFFVDNGHDQRCTAQVQVPLQVSAVVAAVRRIDLRESVLANHLRKWARVFTTKYWRKRSNNKFISLKRERAANRSPFFICIALSIQIESHVESRI
jgi:hypothetical protein